MILGLSQVWETADGSDSPPGVASKDGPQETIEQIVCFRGRISLGWRPVASPEHHRAPEHRTVKNL